MTKQDFITKQREMSRRSNKRGAIWTVFFFAALLGGVALSSYIERHEEEYRWIGAALGIGLFAFLIGNMVLLAWFGVRQQRRFGHRCPACNKALIGVLAQVAIASGCCGHCGERPRRFSSRFELEKGISALVI